MIVVVPASTKDSFEVLPLNSYWNIWIRSTQPIPVMCIHDISQEGRSKSPVDLSLQHQVFYSGYQNEMQDPQKCLIARMYAVEVSA